MGYEVLKIYNNNVVLAKQENETVILISKGIGFGKKVGQIIEKNHSIEKVFHEINPNRQQLNMKHINETYELQEIVDKVIKLAENKMGTLNENTHKILAEHIQFALERIEMGLTIENPFIEEIVSLYPSEFQIAGIALKMIKEKTGIHIGEEERGFIALHLRSARDNRPIRETIKITKMYKQCIEIIEDSTRKKLNLRTKVSKAFLKNLEIFIEMAKKDSNISMIIKETIKNDLSRSYHIAWRISEFVKSEKQVIFTEDLIAYLAIEIEKLIFMM